MKKILFVLRKQPHNGTYIPETLDIIMTAAAFDQKVSLLFLDQAIFQLKKNQHPEAMGLKDISAIYNALPLYDINDVYVETESLQDHGLTLDDLNVNVEEISRANLGDFFKQFDLVLPG
ncbi:MAG: sulfurtransferase complex subunit TusC [Methyloglobulus sp.]|nr:sulfurtransferase complex subunit TusC [Methyloglobulus sp.]